MRKIILFLVFSFPLPFSPLWGVRGAAQTPIVSDPVLTAAVIAQSSQQQSQMSDIETVKKDIAAAQAAASAAMLAIEAIQTKSLAGLTNLSPVVKNLYQLQDCVDAVNDCVKYESLMMDAAAKDPIALAWAAQTQADLETKALNTYAQISDMLMHESGDNLMNSGQRTILLNKILDDLNSLRSLAIQSYNKVECVVQAGLIKSALPSFVNNDAAIIKEISSNFKF
jgi:hypothetical protein